MGQIKNIKLHIVTDIKLCLETVIKQASLLNNNNNNNNNGH